MPLSASAIAKLQNEIVDVAFLWLVTISHPDLVTPLRMVRDFVPLTSRGNVFTPYPQMDIGFPHDSEDQPPRQMIVLEDVGQVFTPALRSLDTTTPPLILIELVMEGEPNTVQDSWTAEIREAQGDGLSIEASLRTDELLGVGAPSLAFTPSLFPALFAGS
jgi:hypothetical protein